MQKLILYMPAYHAGYAKFFAKHKDATVMLLDASLVATVYPKIERDLRAVPSQDLAKMLTSLGTMKSVSVATVSSLQKLGSGDEVIMPQEEVSKLIADRYLKDVQVKYDPIHLRWDSWNSTEQHPVLPDRKVSTSDFDRHVMRQAAAKAKDSPDWWRQVGAAIVKDDKVLLIGHNRATPSDVYTLSAYGDPRSNFDAGVSYDLATAEHGEAHVIGVAARKGLKLDGSSIYVTTFPCPTCAKLIVSAGMKQVYYRDGYSLVDAEQYLNNNDVEIILVKD